MQKPRTKKTTPKTAAKKTPKKTARGPKPPAALALLHDPRPQFVAIYKSLFGKPEDPTNCRNLQKALDEGDLKNIRELLKQLAGGLEVELTPSDIGLFREVSLKTRPMSPVNTDDDIALQARRFWRAAVWGEVDDFLKLTDLIHAYENQEQGSQTKLVTRLKEMVPGSDWPLPHLSDLVELTAEEAKYQPLQWWRVSGNAW
ncbi:MAG: hypothetical protein R3B70_23190 [Polyangiaceae bacterium]